MRVTFRKSEIMKTKLFSLIFSLILSASPCFAASFQEISKAAEAGDAHAEYKLGKMYLYGDAVPEDTEEAIKWFQKSAEHGDASAQYFIGAMYY